MIANAQNYPAETCDPKPADGIRIYPPGNTGAIYLPGAAGQFTGCASESVDLLIDGAMHAGG
ncbi:hypothetical protein BH09ACT6_BH09ACT6_10180 [soil metagenome]